MPAKAVTGRHFLQIPGPTNVPARILRAMDFPTIDHRGPAFATLAKECLAGLKTVFRTDQPVIVYPASGTGAWEAALVNTLSPGDRVLTCETGHFAILWQRIAAQFALEVDCIAGDWRTPADPVAIEARLRDDTARRIKAVMVVHNETSTGVTSDIAAVRRALDAADHPALLMVDTISSLASIDYRHDEWGVDVTVGGSQKGLMLPPGLSFNAVSRKALAASGQARLPRAYWRWESMLAANADGVFPFTPATNMLYGLRAALHRLSEEGLANVFARHCRLAEATRCAVRAWGLEIVCRDPSSYSPSLTAVLLPDGFDEAALRATILTHFNLSLGSGLGKLKGRAFRIGHLGDMNDLMLCATLSGVEMGLRLSQIPVAASGTEAAMAYLMQDLGAHGTAA